MNAGRAVLGAARATARPLVSLLFPATCWADDRPVGEGALGLSDNAREEIAKGMLEPYCAKCGSTVSPHAARGAKHDCPRCIHRPMGLQWMVRAGVYDGPLAKLITGLKFNKRWETAKVMAPFVYQALEMGRAVEEQEMPVDLLVPVPLHWRRWMSRGFNQSEELAVELGKIGGWKVAHALQRTRATSEQSHLQSAWQRMENLRGAFAARAIRGMAGKHVWLVDDVCTTGATLQAATRALMTLPKLSRPASVSAAVVCVTDRMSIADASE